MRILDLGKMLIKYWTVTYYYERDTGFQAIFTEVLENSTEDSEDELIAARMTSGLSPSMKEEGMAAIRFLADDRKDAFQLEAFDNVTSPSKRSAKPSACQISTREITF